MDVPMQAHFISYPLPAEAVLFDRVDAYNEWLVAISYLLAVLGSYLALNLLFMAHQSHGRKRVLGTLVGAVVMATGIWSMHYTGMLAAQTTMNHAYSLPLVVLSCVVA